MADLLKDGFTVPVRFTTRCGVMFHEDEGKFVADVEVGTEGRLLGPHPNPLLDGWYLAEVPAQNVTNISEGWEQDVEKAGFLVVPVHPSHYEQL